MPRVLAPGPAEAEKDPEEQGWAARQGAGEGPGWAWPCPPPQNPAGCTHWRQDPPFSQLTPAPTDPVGSTHGKILSPLGWAPISGWVGVTFPPAQGAPVSVGFPQALPGHGAGRWLSIGPGTALAWCPHTALQEPWSAGWGAATPPRPGRGPRVVLAGGSQGREAREELFMFAGAKCLLGTAPAVPGPNYSTRSGPPTQRQPGTERGQRRRAGHRTPQRPPFQCSTWPAVARRIRGWWLALLPWVLVGRRSCCPEELPWDHVLPQPPAHSCSPGGGLWASQMWVLSVLTKLHSQNPPGQRCGARGRAAPRQGPCSPAPTPFPPVPAGAGRGPELPGIQRLVPAPENIAAGPGPNPATRNLPSRPGVAPGSGWTDTRTRRSDHSQGQQQWGWWEI